MGISGFMVGLGQYWGVMMVVMPPAYASECSIVSKGDEEHWRAASSMKLSGVALPLLSPTF